MTSPADRAGAIPRRVGPYRVEGLVAEGGMGVVYRAVRPGVNEPVALKVLRAELAGDPTYLKRFAREGDIAASVEHPNLVRVLERGEAGGAVYLASRYVEGPTLEQRIAAGPIAPHEVAAIVAGIGAALDALHRAGLVHRDVKPANVLLEGPRALLTDFGVARGEGHTTLTKAGRVVGTSDYLAPEVIRGEAAVPASDVYALGCVAYAATAGAPPFAGRPLAQTYLAHVGEPPPSLEPFGASRAMDEAVRRALAKDPAERPRTGTAYGRLLRAAARG